MKKGIAYFVLVSLMVFVLGLATASAIESAPPIIVVPVDIKPTSCPNPLNVDQKGVLPIAILGTGDFDVTQIDPASIVLDGLVSPLRWAYEDVATPNTDMLMDTVMYCTEEGPDGYLDLVLKFDNQEVVETLGLGDACNRLVIMLSLTGMLDYNGFVSVNGVIQIAGYDLVWVINKDYPCEW